MKKALIIAYNDLNNSGVPNVIYQTIKALNEHYSFDVLVFGDDNYYYQKLRDESINIGLIKYIDKKPKNKIARLFWRVFRMSHNYYAFTKALLKNNDYSVVHSFKEYYGWPFLKAAKEAGVHKRIFHCNVNLKSHKTFKNALFVNRGLKRSIKYSNELIGVSELSCNNAFSNNKYTVLFNSFDEEKYNLNVKNYLKDDELVITHVASYNENKNQLFSLKILKELKKLNNGAKLNLVGAADMNPYFQSLIDYSKSNHLEKNVVFVEKTADVKKIYEHTSFAILPSFSEGFSLTTLEAQACGIIVFASANIPRDVNAGGVIFLELSKGPIYWANAINKRFIEQRNSRTKFDTNKFTFERFKKRIEILYK